MPGIVDSIGRVLSSRMSVGEVMELGLIVSTPHLAIGLISSWTHTAHLQEMPCPDLVPIVCMQ